MKVRFAVMAVLVAATGVPAAAGAVTPIPNPGAPVKLALLGDPVLPDDTCGGAATGTVAPGNFAVVSWPSRNDPPDLPPMWKADVKIHAGPPDSDLDVILFQTNGTGDPLDCADTLATLTTNSAGNGTIRVQSPLEEDSVAVFVEVDDLGGTSDYLLHATRTLPIPECVKFGDCPRR